MANSIALSLAATVTRAGYWPDGWRCVDASDVLVWSGEDAPEVLTARLAASDADLKRVHFIGGVGNGAFDPSRDVPELERAIRALPSMPALMVIDPVVAAVSGDGHKSNDVRRALQPLVDLGHRHGIAVLGITHFSKGTAGRDPTERITGSVAFGALARVVLVAAKVQSEGEDAEPRRVLLRAKSNIGPDHGGFAYALERVEVAKEVEGQRVRWLEKLDGAARELLAEAEAAEPASDGGEQSAVEAADGFLRELLADITPAKEVRRQANEAGHSWASVRRAAVQLGVKRSKGAGSMTESWYWSLPEGAQETSKVLTRNGEHLREKLSTFEAPADDAELI